MVGGECTATYIMATPLEIKVILLAILFLLLWQFVNGVLTLFKLAEKPDSDEISYAVQKGIKNAEK